MIIGRCGSSPVRLDMMPRLQTDKSPEFMEPTNVHFRTSVDPRGIVDILEMESKMSFHARDIPIHDQLKNEFIPRI